MPASLNETVDLLGRCLGTVLREQEGEAFFALEERVRLGTKELRDQRRTTAPMQETLDRLELDAAERLVRAFSTYFQLINLAEEHARVERVLEPSTGMRKEGFEQALRTLQSEGLDADAAARLIAGVDLGLTFTAHPTEMRRRTVRGHLKEISDLLADPKAADDITAHVEALWRTPWLRHRQPTVRDEVNGGLAYVEIIAQVLPGLERDLEAAFARVFGTRRRLHLPLSLHSWMGGDRDGNPHVTPKVTEETLALHAERAERGLLSAFDESFARLSQSDEGGAQEPYRDRLRTVADAVRGHDAGAVIERTAALERALIDARQTRSADVLERPLALRARMLGLHYASLDVREHSSLTGAAVAQLLEQDGRPGYLELTEPQKIDVLRRELATRRPLLPAGQTAPEAIARVVDPLRAAHAARARAGERAFGRYIVSMSEQPSDLLEVLVLAREAGLTVAPVPLFETLDDLKRAPAVMQQVLSMPEYRRALGDDVQEVMIGYSDSSKDGGFVAANWALHEAQRHVARVCAEAGVRHRFFHGRGTSIGRGGGPTARAMLGQPAGTVGAGIRITEQGEALQDKYSHPALAWRNLEQALYGLLLAAGRPSTPLEPAWLSAMESAAAVSAQAYRALVHDPRFLPFFEAVTPIREISRLRIASRPVRRPGPSQLSNLRAIPWVMSWTQCRAIVPGWYGLDVGLDAVTLPLARTLYEGWPFFRSMIDNAQMALAKTDLDVFDAYCTLATDGSLAALVRSRFATTVEKVCAVTQAELLANEPRLMRSIQLRNPYIDPIHRLQVGLLRKARALPESAELPAQLETALLMSLHGIAAGMRNTG
jgi:phosphoenolpyruvate carboxylase